MSEPLAPAAAADPIRVLVLDDEEGIRRLCARVLTRSADISVVAVENGRRGLRALISQSFDVLLVDLYMEEMSGAAFLQEAFAIWPWLRVVLITGAPESPLAQAARGLGVTRILGKPFSPAQLEAVVREEARAARERVRTPESAARQKLCDQLRVLAEVTRTATESATLAEALRHLSDGLSHVLPCVAMGILVLEDEQPHLAFSVRQAGLQAALRGFGQQMVERLEALSGCRVKRDAIQMRVEGPEGQAADPQAADPQAADPQAADPQAADPQAADPGPWRLYIVPFLVGEAIGGVMGLVRAASAALADDDLAFFYQAPSHMAAVFSALGRVRHLAVHDNLTGLYNRLYVEEALQNALDRRRRYRYPAAVVMMDVDHLKRVNDTEGHLAGDQLLREFANILRRVARKSDVIGRFGGDEFVALLTSADAQGAAAFADRLLAETRTRTLRAGNHEIPMSVSLGGTELPGDTDEEITVDRVLARADEALYAAKNGGRNQARIWPDLHTTPLTSGSALVGVRVAASPAAPAKAAAKGRVLVVDDEEIIQLVARRLLEREGYSVDSCSSAEACLAKVRVANGAIDVVLTDINMPGMSGIELLKRLAEADSTIFRVVMTGMPTMDYAVASLREGAYDFIKKPIDVDQLRSVFERAMDHRRALVENRRYQAHLESMVLVKSAEARHTLDEVERSYEFTLEAMARMLDAREQDTGGHSARVRDQALVLARHLRLAPEQTRVLAQGALLHDIGKIGVPDAVLLKAGSLTPEEWRQMRTHPEVGYTILRGASWLREAAEIVRSHHEHHDGTGYPSGLKGHDICLGARLFAVLDSYDAMRSDRVYRKALTIEAAVGEVRKGNGTQFDPEMVDAFMACLDELEAMHAGAPAGTAACTPGTAPGPNP